MRTSAMRATRRCSGFSDGRGSRRRSRLSRPNRRISPCLSRQAENLGVLTTLRALVCGGSVAASAVTRAPLHLMHELAEGMKNCRFGIVYFGLGLSVTGLGQRIVAALLLLDRDRNAYTCICVGRMRVPSDVTGVNVPRSGPRFFQNTGCARRCRPPPRATQFPQSAEVMWSSRLCGLVLFVVGKPYCLAISCAT